MFEGQIDGKGLRFAIVVTRFNEFITGAARGRADALIRHGVVPSDIDVAWVPGRVRDPVRGQKMSAAAGRGGATMRSSASAQ